MNNYQQLESLLQKASVLDNLLKPLAREYAALENKYSQYSRHNPHIDWILDFDSLRLQQKEKGSIDTLLFIEKQSVSLHDARNILHMPIQFLYNPKSIAWDMQQKWQARKQTELYRELKDEYQNYQGLNQGDKK